MMKVLHCVSVMDRAGQETFIMNVFRKIDKTEFMFKFLCTSKKKGDYDDEIYALGGEIFYLPENKYKHGLKNWINEIKILTKWLVENKDKYDIVHLHTCHALSVLIYAEACRRAEVKTLVVHCHSTSAPHKLLNYICREVCKFYTFEKNACSYEAAKWLYGSKNINKAKINLVYNGIDVPKYKYEQEISDKYRDILKINNKIVIGHVGRFVDVKNHELLVDIFFELKKSLPEVVLLLVGTGELESQIKEKVKQLGIADSVIFLGSRCDVNNLMMVMDVLVFPSKYEGLSVVLVEAQAAGLRSIVSAHIVPKEEEIVPELFEKVEINREIVYWCEAIKKSLSKNYNRAEANRIVSESYFNIENTVRMLQNEYRELKNNCV